MSDTDTRSHCLCLPCSLLQTYVTGLFLQLPFKQTYRYSAIHSVLLQSFFCLCLLALRQFASHGATFDLMSWPICLPPQHIRLAPSSICPAAFLPQTSAAHLRPLQSWPEHAAAFGSFGYPVPLLFGTPPWLSAPFADLLKPHPSHSPLGCMHPGENNYRAVVAFSEPTPLALLSEDLRCSSANCDLSSVLGRPFLFRWLPWWRFLRACWEFLGTSRTLWSPSWRLCLPNLPTRVPKATTFPWKLLLLSFRWMHLLP